MFLLSNWRFPKSYKTALMLAVEYGHIDVVKLLLEKGGIDLDAKSVPSLFSKSFLFLRSFNSVFGIYSFFIAQL